MCGELLNRLVPFFLKMFLFCFSHIYENIEAVKEAQRAREAFEAEKAKGAIKKPARGRPPKDKKPPVTDL